MERDELQQQLFAWLQPAFELVYPNPKNTLVVPFDTTRVVLDSEPLGDGRLAVHLRAAILMDLEPSDDIAAYVALHANNFRFGNLYMFGVDGALDLDYAYTVMSTWLDAATTVELVTLAGNNAVATSRELHERFGGRLANPSGQAHRLTFIGPERRDRRDVWDVLNRTLETQSCLLLGTAERIELAGAGVLTEGWMVVNTQYLWFAGRDHATRATTLWRIPHTDVANDRVTVTSTGPTYTAHLHNGTTLSVTTVSEEAVAALHAAHHDPRDLNEPR